MRKQELSQIKVASQRLYNLQERIFKSIVFFSVYFKIKYSFLLILLLAPPTRLGWKSSSSPWSRLLFDELDLEAVSSARSLSLATLSCCVSRLSQLAGPS